MPLSEDEERILSQIEQQLYASDPDLARNVGRSAEPSRPRRTALLSGFGIVAGLVLSVALLSVSPVAAWILGFGVMCFSAIRLESALRWRWSDSLSSAASIVRSFGLRETPESDDGQDEDDDF